MRHHSPLLRGIVSLTTTIAFITIFARPAFALEDADNWDQQADANGTVTITDGSILIEGSNNPLPGQPWQDTVTSITTDSSQGETVSFDWEYWTTDGVYYDQAQMLVNNA